MAQEINPDWDIKPKHSLRFADDLWKPVDRKVVRLKREGYPTSVNDLLRQALAVLAEETDDETVARLGLQKRATS